MMEVAKKKAAMDTAVDNLYNEVKSASTVDDIFKGFEAIEKVEMIKGRVEGMLGDDVEASSSDDGSDAGNVAASTDASSAGEPVDATAQDSGSDSTAQTADKTTTQPTVNTTQAGTVSADQVAQPVNMDTPAAAPADPTNAAAQ